MGRIRGSNGGTSRQDVADARCQLLRQPTTLPSHCAASCFGAHCQASVRKQREPPFARRITFTPTLSTGNGPATSAATTTTTTTTAAAAAAAISPTTATALRRGSTPNTAKWRRSAISIRPIAGPAIFATYLHATTTAATSASTAAYAATSRTIPIACISSGSCRATAERSLQLPARTHVPASVRCSS
jgi:hypothetical protein